MTRYAGRVPCPNPARSTISIAITLAMLLSSGVVQAQSGSLDATFSTDGKTTQDFLSGRNDEANAVIVQADGKIVTVGGSTSGFPGAVAISRHDANGNLDAGFGTGGLVTTNVGARDEGRAVLQLPDGKLLVGGGTRSPGDMALLQRYLADGSLDTGFGSGGSVTQLVGINGAWINDIVRQPDGKIVVTAAPDAFLIGTNYNAYVARFNADGTLDASFGSGGVVAIDFGANLDTARALVLQEDGKIVIVGNRGFADAIVLARFNTDGTLDAGFGTGGMVATTLPDGEQSHELALQDDGKLVVAAQYNDDFLVLRFTTAGALDSAFGGGNGYVLTDFGNNDGARDVALQSDGKIVVGGYAETATNTAFGVARYLSDGSLDVSFDGDGKAFAEFPDGAEANAIALQGDGKIVAAGLTYPGASGNDFAIARFLGDQADLTVAKTASSPTVAPGDNFNYTINVSNSGPETASNVLVADTLPPQTTFVSCFAPGGTCSNTGNDVEVTYPAIASGANQVVTINATLNASTHGGTVVNNTASAGSVTLDPAIANNSSTASITAQVAPHTVRFYLHGNDIPGTAGGYTMNLTPPTPPVTLGVSLASNPHWNSSPPINGTFAAGNFQLRFPCTLGLGVATSFALQRTDLMGGNVQTIGSTSQLLSLCVGQTVVNIPVYNAQPFSNERLRLRVSNTLGLTLNLSLDHNTYLQTTNLTGSP